MYWQRVPQTWSGSRKTPVAETVICTLADKSKREYLKKCNKEFLECAKNVLRGNVPLTARQKARLRRSKNDLRLLSVKNTSLRKKRQIVQKGGFLGDLIDIGTVTFGRSSG